MYKATKNYENIQKRLYDGVGKYGIPEIELNGKITGVSAGDVRFVDMNGKDMIERNGRNVEGD